MLDTLIASAPRRHRFGSRLTGNAVSLTVHASVITAAVLGTMKSDEVAQGIKRYFPIEFVDFTPEDERAKLDIMRLPPLTASVTLIAPLKIPVGIPPVDHDRFFTLPDPRGLGTPEGVFDSVVGSDPDGGAQVFIPAALDEAPERISSPPLEYPRLMRQAGIEGTVLLQAIVDTAGHVEIESVKVVSSDNRSFETAARQLLERSLFRPGRVRGRPVRVLIQLPVQFRLNPQ